MAEITQMLEAIRQGDAAAGNELFALVYRQLRQVAAQKLACEGAAQTIQPTELVHEAWIRLASHQQREWQGRAHFFGAAAEAMRRILVERARRRKCLKRGGRWERVDFDELDIPSPIPDDELLALDEALVRLADFDARAAEVMNLCFFVGLTHEQAAEELGVSLSTIERTWTFARAWLFREIHEKNTLPAQTNSTPPRETSREAAR